MDNIMSYILVSPLKLKYYDDDIVVFPEQRFVCVKHDKTQLDYLKTVKAKYKFRSYELNQEKLWELVQENNLTLIDINFKNEITPEDKSHLIQNRDDHEFYHIKKYLTKKNEINELTFIFKNINYTINKFGTLTFAIQKDNFKELVLIPPLFKLLGINVRGGWT